MHRHPNARLTWCLLGAGSALALTLLLVDRAASLGVIAALRSRLYPGLAHYPLAWFERSPTRITWSGREAEQKR